MDWKSGLLPSVFNTGGRTRGHLLDRHADCCQCAAFLPGIKLSHVLGSSTCPRFQCLRLLHMHHPICALPLSCGRPLHLPCCYTWQTVVLPCPYLWQNYICLALSCGRPYICLALTCGRLWFCLALTCGRTYICLALTILAT